MMNRLISLVGALALVSTVAGCSMVGGTKAGSTGAGGGDDEPATGLAGTMAEAPMYHRGSTITAPAECHTSGYARLDTLAGETMQIEVTIDAPAETCLSVHYLNANGGVGFDGAMMEICSADSPKTFEAPGLEGGSFLQISEAGVCQGANVTVAIR